MILGCSNLTGRYWIGSLWYYRDPNEAPSVEKALTGVDFDNGLVDGFFIDDKSIIVACDNGAVEQVRLSFSDESDPAASYFFLERTASAHEHDDLITGLVMADEKYITASYDRSIVVLDKSALKLVSRVQDAHSDLVNHVAVNPSNLNIFSTAGNDGRVPIWDLRTLNADSSTCQPCKFQHSLRNNVFCQGYYLRYLR